MTYPTLMKKNITDSNFLVYLSTNVYSSNDTGASIHQVLPFLCWRSLHTSLFLVAAKEQFQHCTRSQAVFLLGDIWLQQIVDGNCNHVGFTIPSFQGLQAGDKHLYTQFYGGLGGFLTIPWLTQAGLHQIHPWKLTWLAGRSPFCVGNSASSMVHFPSSYVSLPRICPEQKSMTIARMSIAKSTQLDL